MSAILQLKTNTSCSIESQSSLEHISEIFGKRNQNRKLTDEYAIGISRHGSVYFLNTLKHASILIKIYPFKKLVMSVNPLDH